MRLAPTTFRPLRAAVVAASMLGAIWVALLAAAAAAPAAQLEADFHFNETRTAPTGETVANVGDGNSFAAESVDGGAARQVLTFPAGGGLSLPTTGLAGSGSYSVAVLFRLDGSTTGRRKLIDLSGGTSDAGLYLCDGALVIELLAATPCPFGSGSGSGWAQVVLTRDDATGGVAAYLDGAGSTANDSLGALSLGSELRLFLDDAVLPADEHSAGAIARLRVYDGALSAAEVAALDRVDQTPPGLALDPVSTPTTDATPAFTGTAGNEAGDLTTVSVKVYSGSSATGTPVTTASATRDGATWTATLTDPLSDGTYTAQADQADGAGNLGGSEARTFAVDSAGPAVSLTTPAAGATNDATPTYSGTAGDAAGDSANVTVKVYSGSAATGSPLQTLTATRTGGTWTIDGSPALGDGTHTAIAEQADGAGNAGTSAPRTFTVDTTEPDTTIDSAPADPTNDSTPRFAFSSADAEGFVCRLYRADVASAPAFGGCSSPRETGPLADGSYVFQVAAVDAAGNQDGSPGSRTFRVDTTAPQVAFSVAPGDTIATDATFVFAAGEPASFTCRLDGGAWEACGSPRSYSGLPLGAHALEVSASDQAGNQGAAARHAWQVLKPGETIPGASRQAVALAQDIVQLRRALRRVPLTRAARRGAIGLTGIDALTPGTMRLVARARNRRFALAKRTLSAAGSYRLRLVLTRAGRRLARSVPKLRVDLRLSFTDSLGRALQTTTTTTMFRRPPAP